MLEGLKQIDSSLFLFLNGLGGGFSDNIMIFFSKLAVWVPLYLAILFFLFYKPCQSINAKGEKRYSLKKRELKFSFLFLAGIIVTFALTDQTAGLIKDFVHRLRPSNDPSLAGFIHLLEKPGGLYGFVSNHATNVFGLAIFSSLTFKKRGYSWFIFTWAFIVSFSRIMVGKHYPGDVLAGAILGLAIGYLVYRIIFYIYERNKIR